jgi:ethanolamine utilization protein EutP (predicted NTPase)
MDGLTGYQQRRLELGDLIRAVLAVVHAHGDERREQQIRGLLTRLAAGRFQLAVIGQFSRGKTTLMNALLGKEYLPMGALPMTSVVTTVRYGTRARALVRSHAAALAVEIPVTEVARFVARASAERTRMQVTSVEMEIPAELLRLGFEFVDTPGVGSAIAANTAATLRYLPQADAVVFVTGFDSALTSAEADFLNRTATQVGKLFVVINKRDLVSDAEVAEVTRYVQRWAHDRLPAEPPVFAISALQGLAGAVNGDLRQLADSGVGPLREALTRFLTAERGRIALRAIAAAAADLVARQQRDLRAGQRTDGGPGLDSIVAGFESQLSGLQDQLAIVADRIAATTDTAVTHFLAERGPSAEAELAGLLAPAAALPPDAVVPDGDLVAGAIDVLRLAGRQAVSDWLERRTAELGETLTAAAADDIGDLLRLARSPRELGAATAGLATFADAPAGWTAEDIPRLTLPVVDWTVPDPRAGHWRRRGRRTAADAASHEISAAIAAAVADFAARAGAAFRLVAADWTRRLAEQARGLAVAEAAQFRRYLSAPARDDDLVVLADIGRRLAGFHDSLAALATVGGGLAAGSDAEPQTEPIRGADRTCAICAQLETAQTTYLIRRQFLLATSEADQARHAETGGFCPLHTWQYAQLASPVGISAGNARLASLLAGTLREAAAHSRGPGELARRVAELARTTACPACVVVAATERKAADELAAHKPGDAEPPRLCLRHLALVLETGSSLPTGRVMTSALAATLQRASEDMRAYALKREAMSRGLITADEASAYSDALRLLAGQPSLALPAIPE